MMNSHDPVSELCNRFEDAKMENSELLQFLALIFLKFRNYDVDAAQERLENYLKWRVTLFGNLRNQTIENNEQLENQIQTCFVQVLPHYMESGVGCLYLRLDRHNPSQFDADDTIRCWHFVLMSALRKNPELAIHGFLIFNDMGNVGLRNLDMSIPDRISSAISKCMPIRVANMFIFHPPYILSFGISILKLLLSQKLGQRLHVVHDIESFINEFHIPIEVLPLSLDGTCVEYNADSHLAHLRQCNALT